jgi:predicted amidohydrolase YtcJ
MRVFLGTIITVDRQNSIRHCLVEDQGRIVFVGDELPESYTGAEKIELGERALMPAFADTHSHFASFAMLATTIKLDKAKTNGEIKEILAEADREYPKGKTLLCFGATPKVREGSLITKQDIAHAVKSRRAVVILCGDGHTCVLNDVALSRMPRSLAALRGYHADTGIMSQEAFYKAAGSLLRIVSIKDGLQAFQDAVDLYAERGVGLVCAECAQGFPLDIDVELVKWVFRGQNSGIQLRLFIQSFDPRKAKCRGVSRLGGCFETALDGSLTSMDAALNLPYEGTDKKGVLFYTDDQLFERLDKVNRAGMQIQMHAIGDAAVDQATRVLKRALDAYPREDHRHGIIHGTFVSPESMKILKEYKVQVVGQPAFIGLSEQNYEFMHSFLGDRVFAAEPHNQFIEQGILFSASSDAPVTTPDPISWIHWMVNNPNVPHRLSLHDAIRVCTFNGYASTFDEKERGSLETGKTADMVILNKDPFRVPKSDIKDIKVEQVFLGGKPFVRSGESVIRAILRGIGRKHIKV